MIEHIRALPAWRLAVAAVSAVALLVLFAWKARRAIAAPGPDAEARRRALDCYRPRGE